MSLHPADRRPGRSRCTLLTLALLASVPLTGPALRADESADDARAPSAAASRGSARTTEHLARLGAAAWHQDGVRGRGVKVAILDTGFRGYRDFLGTALPAKVTVRSFRADHNLEARDSQHGILCGEVVHALAPEAELLLANWEGDDPSSFVEAVRWAVQEGARVISCSVIMPAYSDGEGGGPTHRALARCLGPGRGRDDSLLFACAGNTAQRHWAGPFRAGADGWHEWAPGVIDNPLSPWGGERVSVELLAADTADYEVLVRDLDSGEVVGTSRSRTPALRVLLGDVVRFEPSASRRYGVRVRLLTGRPGPFHLLALHSGLDCTTARGSIVFPADGPEVLAVGAVNADGRRASYSSCGPNSGQPKPDLVAPVPFPSASRAKPFAGTSAAAPQAAALAALVWSRQASWTAGQVQALLRSSARDLGPTGHDWETGYGLIRLPGSARVTASAARPAARAQAP